MAEKPEEKPALPLEATLLLPHEHGGKAYKKGDKITVTAAQAKWLRSRGVITQHSTGVKT